MKDGANVTDGSGGTSASYTSGALSGNTTYSVVVSNGACSVTSSEALVTVTASPTAPTGLSANVTRICNGVATNAILTAAGGTMGAGAVYEWGTGAVGSNPLSPATTTATTYSVSPNAATTYWVRLVGTGVCTATTTAGATTSIATYPAVSAGAIKSGSTTINFGETLNVTVTSTEVASGGNSSYTYRWRLTGTSSATLTTGTTATTYLLSISPSNYNAGTYYFNRYVRDATCSNDAAWVAATGTYTLIVNGPPSGSPPTTLCKQCCYDGSLWVDCYVTTNAHPFQNSTPNTAASWSGNAVYYSRATSDKNGRANTAAITGATTGSAVQLCKDLGTGWYLPAYDELYAMSSGAAGTYSNTRTGAGLLTPNGSYWSSTEWYNHEGRIPQPDIYSGLIQAYMEIAMTVNSSGGIGSSHKTEEKRYVRCAWRK
jgi:hypothetical protein